MYEEAPVELGTKRFGSACAGEFTNGAGGAFGQHLDAGAFHLHGQAVRAAEAFGDFDVLFHRSMKEWRCAASWAERR